MLFFLVTISLPCLIVLIMNGVEGLIEELGRIRRSMKVGWDLCVVGLGASGGIVLDAQVLDFLGTGWAIAADSFSIAASLGFSVIIAHFRKKANNPGNPGNIGPRHAVISLALGALALTVPAFLALHRY